MDVRYPDAPDEGPREAFGEVITVGASEGVVTVIETLSHGNRSPGSRSRELCLAKQQHIRGTEIHLLEIDFPRAGAQTVAAFNAERVWRRELDCDYVVSLCRAGSIEPYGVWPIRLRERLPHICIPLASGDPDLTLDLQAIFDRCHDAGPYRRVDYRRDPTPLQRAEDAAWADALLREKGLRN